MDSTRLKDKVSILIIFCDLSNKWKLSLSFSNQKTNFVGNSMLTTIWKFIIDSDSLWNTHSQKTP